MRPQKTVERFKFNRHAVSVSPDLVERSVPGYAVATRIVGIIESSCLKRDFKCDDLGCALSGATQSVLDAVGNLPVSILGIDSSREMLVGARTKITDARTSFQHGDLRSFSLENCNVVIMNCSLQFSPIRDRIKVLRNVRALLKPGGVLILSERVQADIEFEEMHLAFRKSNQYSELEIDQGNAAFKRILHSETLIEHMIRLRKVGFTEPRVWLNVCIGCRFWLANDLHDLTLLILY